ncbi:GNAT family N-acetyltransferase, partial [Streptomyces sparsus]
MISVDRDERRALLDRIERYYDAVPRSAARAEDFGPLTLFVRSGSGWPFYARPTPGRSAPVGAADVTRVRERQRELGMPESIEWVAESAPALRTATEQAGLVAHEHPLMVLDPEAPVPAAPAPPEGVDVRIVGPDDAGLPGALAVPYLAFTEPGADSAAEPARLVEVARYLVADGSVKQTAARVRAGLTCVAAAYGDGTALCAGQHQPVGAVTE